MTRRQALLPEPRVGARPSPVSTTLSGRSRQDLEKQKGSRGPGSWREGHGSQSCGAGGLCPDPGLRLQLPLWGNRAGGKRLCGLPCDQGPPGGGSRRPVGPGRAGWWALAAPPRGREGRARPRQPPWLPVQSSAGVDTGSWALNRERGGIYLFFALKKKSAWLRLSYRNDFFFFERRLGHCFQLLCLNRYFSVLSSEICP